MSEKIKLKKGDILLLLLYVDNCSTISGRTRLQKMLFVFEKELLKKYGFDKNLAKKNDSFEFNAHNYGPYSKEVFELMDFFVNAEWVQVTYAGKAEQAFDDVGDLEIALEDLSESSVDFEDEAISAGEPVYLLGEKGKKFVKEKLLNYLNADQIQALTQLKRTFTAYSLNHILKYIYTKYPDMTSKSLVREKVLGTKWNC